MILLTISGAGFSDAGPLVLVLLALIVGLGLGRMARKAPQSPDGSTTFPKQVKDDRMRPSREMPMRYVVAALAIMALFLTAIVLPDILRFFSQPTSATQVTPGATAVTQAPAAPVSMSAANPTAATAQLFESYARLVTLFLGVASVLAVFFGYFVRKSIRETEEDVDKRFDRSLNLWEKERSSLLDQYKADALKLVEKITVVDGLEKKMRELMQELTDALQTTRNPPDQSGAAIDATATKVDDQLKDL